VDQEVHATAELELGATRKRGYKEGRYRSATNSGHNATQARPKPRLLITDKLMQFLSG